MASIVVYSMAYRGDVFPYVPIAGELARRGHDVTYVVPREFHALFVGEPFRCVHSGTDFGPAALNEHAAYVARWGMRIGGGMLLRLYFGVFTIPHLEELFEAVDAELEHADLLVSHPAASLVGAMSCERRGIPWVVGDLFPMLVPSVHVPPAGLPGLGRRANAAAWRLGRSSAVDRMTSADKFKAYRRRLGLPTDGWNVVDARLSPHGNLGLVSRHYVDPLPDWPDGYELSGFTLWEGPGGGRVPDDVRAFLDAGEAPIIVTLGTSAASARPELFAAAAAALDRLGERGVFLTSNEEIAQRLGDAEICARHGVWPFVPLAPLLPSSKGIVHSGAHGTNALALAAGVPSVIAPCLFDQRWHARRQAELGSAVWVRHPRALASALERLGSDEVLTRCAQELGDRIAGEDGTRRACDHIETVLRSGCLPA